MRIHVFYVNKGEMLTFDMNLAMEYVSALKGEIAREVQIPIPKQVLLLSGGTPMLSHERFSQHSAGTEGNPIFLFNLMSIESKNPPDMHIDIDRPDIQRRIEASMNMAPTLATVSIRTQLALEVRDQSFKYRSLCKTIVQYQHMQHQGWSSAVVNMDDVLKEFIHQADNFRSWFTEFIEKKNTYLEMLHSIRGSVELLSKIPILECLTEITNGSICDRFNENMPTTLMQFLTALDANENLVSEAETALNELSQLESSMLDRLMAKKKDLMQQTDNKNMKEVGGLEHRLSGLDQFISSADKIAEDQENYAKGFVQNQNRLRQLSDPNLLPDLCESHREQLRVMGDEFSQLEDIYIRCLETKRELSANLHTRLRWLMYIENKVTTTNDDIGLHHQNCIRLKNRIDKLEQISRAPVVYAKLCVEVCRRKQFALRYQTWGERAFLKSKELHQGEVEQRREFYRSIGKHFLKALFPGLELLPPQLMFSSTPVIDKGLPDILTEDIAQLRQSLPELEEWLRLPGDPLTPVAGDASDSQENSDIAVIASPQSDPEDDNDESGNAIGELIGPLQTYDEGEISDDQAPASLTDDTSGGFMTANFNFPTEEFPPHDPSPYDKNQMAETITMQNSVIERLTSDQAKYKAKCEELSHQVLHLTRIVATELSALKVEKDLVKQDTLELYSSAAAYKEQVVASLNSGAKSLSHRAKVEEEEEKKELLNQLAVYVQQQDIFVKQIDDLQGVIKGLSAQVEALQMTHQVELSDVVKKTRAEIVEELGAKFEEKLSTTQQNYTDSLRAKDAESTEQVRELNEKLKLLQASANARQEELSQLRVSLEEESRLALQKLTQRFDKEKQELCMSYEQQIAEQASAIEENVGKKLADLRATLEEQYKVECAQTTAKATNTTEDLINTIKEEFHAAMELEKQEAISKVTQDRDAELSDIMQNHEDALQQQEALHKQELEYRATMMKESLSRVSEMKLDESLAKLRREKDAAIDKLQLELSNLRSALAKPASSVLGASAMGDSVMSADINQSVQARDSVSESLRDALDNEKVSVKSCHVGDKVILCYDERHEHYVVFTISNTLHFLHSDCLEPLGLEVASGQTRRSWLLVEITNKEYCQARKPHNRFNVPLNTKFYRVRAQPWNP